MGEQNAGKLNRLLAELGDTSLVSSRWLRAHGYSNSLVARYVGSGWLGLVVALLGIETLSEVSESMRRLRDAIAAEPALDL